MSKTILCVDDSVTMQKVASITFAATEYECVGGAATSTKASPPPGVTNRRWSSPTP